MGKKPVDCPLWFNKQGTQWFLTKSKFDKALEKNEFDSFDEIIESVEYHLRREYADNIIIEEATVYDDEGDFFLFIDRFSAR